MNVPDSKKRSAIPTEEAGKQKLYSCSEAKRRTWILTTVQIEPLIISSCSSEKALNIHVKLTAYSFP